MAEINAGRAEDDGPVELLVLVGHGLQGEAGDGVAPAMGTPVGARDA